MDQMQEGIGRGGYRLMALFFAGLGGLGVITTLVAFEQPDLEQFFRWLGFVLTAISIFSLLFIVLVILGLPKFELSLPQRRRADPEPSDLPPATGSDADIGLEYAAEEETVVEPEPVPAPPPGPRGPPPRPQPAPPPFVHPPSRPRDAKGWPARKEATGVTRRQVAEQTFTPEPAPPAPKPGVREPPLIMARTAASADAAGLPDNVSVGKCGNCGVLLMAPKKRPIRLQCPRCERVHTLA